VDGIANDNRQQIGEGDVIPIKVTVLDCKLMEDLVLDEEYLERLRPSTDSAGLVGDYTLDELEDMLGYIAAGANHSTDTRIRPQLMDLFNRLTRIQRSYDDGNWNDSK